MATAPTSSQGIPQASSTRVGWSDGPVLFDLGGALDDYRFDRDLRNDLGPRQLASRRGRRARDRALRLECCHTRLATGPDTD
jgi:hypothetical protein